MFPVKKAVQLSISPEQIIEAVKAMDKEMQDVFIEDLLIEISKDYVESIREARKDYQEGRVFSHDEVFK